MGFINNTFTKLQTKAEENSTFTKLQTKAEENTTFTKLQTKAEETFDKVKVKNTKTTVRKPNDSTTSPTTSWEKSVANIDVIVTEVSRGGRDVDIVCVGGGKGEKTTLGVTMEEVLTDAFEKDLKKRSVSVLVLTTGRKPDDASLLEKSLSDAAKKVAKSGVKESPLSVTFIQIDEEQRAGVYLKQLERKMAGERIQIVDTMTDAEIISTMKSINKSTKSSSKTGLIAGGLAGAAISAGGMYAYNKRQEAKKSSKKSDFNGQFKCFYNDEEVTTLQVVDDRRGNLTIEGYHEEITVSGKYSGFHEVVNKTNESTKKKGQTPRKEDIDIEVDEKIHVHEVIKKSSGEEIDIDIDVKIDMKEKAAATKSKPQCLGEVDVESEVFIRFTNRSGELIEGTYVEEERIINWSDGSRWEAHVSSEEGRVNNTKLVAGAAVVGAIAAGTTGYMMDKKFFNKVTKKDQCDYIIIVDRSAKMEPHNTCATTEKIDIKINEEIRVHEDIINKKESANKNGRTCRKEDIEVDIEIDEKIHVHEDFKKSSGDKTKRTKEEIDIEIDVKIDVKEKVTATKQKAQIPAYLRK